MAMPATRFLVITVTRAAMLGGRGDHLIVSISGDHRG
jgi:hypothetical protein